MARAPLLSALAVTLGVALAGCAQIVDVEVADLDVEPVDPPAQSHVYAADGTRIATLRLVHRERADPDELPDVLVDAVVAAEDRRFFEHGGVDGQAVVRAALANQRAGEVVEGGSTITQQLVKNRYFPDAEQSLERKAAEAHLARDLERRKDKDEILAAYLDTVYFGTGAHGVVAAAETYFDTEPADLRLEQAALLAGLIRSPEGASPHREPRRARELRDDVLAAMAEAELLTREEAERAARRPLGVAPPPPPPDTRYPHFVEAVKRELRAEPALGSDEAERLRRLHADGLRVHTTIVPAAQAAAEEAAASFSDDPDAPEVAVAAVRPVDGAVVALVGGRDFDERQFDLATQARRQPGSAFKTFALVAALKEGWRLDDRLASGSTSIALGGDDHWRVRSATSGDLSLRRALALSSNGAFARLGDELDDGAIAGAAEALGVTSTVGEHPSVALGGLEQGVSPLEMASAYATLAAGGVRSDPVTVTRIEDAEGRTVWEPRHEPRVVLDAEHAWFALEALGEVVASGTGTLADPGRPAAGKTGTSQDHRDAWFVGTTPELAAAVWMGHPDTAETARDPRSGRPLEGGGWPARIWRRSIEQALDGVEAGEFPYPAHLERTVEVNPESGDLATAYCPETVEVTGLPGELPTEYCTLHHPPEDETGTAAPEPTASPSPGPTPSPTPSPVPSPETDTAAPE